MEECGIFFVDNTCIIVYNCAKEGKQEKEWRNGKP